MVKDNIYAIAGENIYKFRGLFVGAEIPLALSILTFLFHICYIRFNTSGILYLDNLKEKRLFKVVIFAIG